MHTADHRVDPPRQWPFVAPVNQYSANVRGSTYFLPVVDLTALYINVMLSFFDGDFAMFAVDDHNGYQPAELARFARSAGGHLHDDPSAGRLATVTALETWMCEFCAVELGAILQNLGLIAAALGLGGFPHFAAHPFIWFQALGFRMEPVASSNRRYGRFPASTGPFRTLLAYQAHHVDPDFYDHYYRTEVLTPAHRQHPTH